MQSIDKALAWTSFALIALTLLIGPWLFGAWEAWHFWPFVTLIFITAFLFSIRLFLKSYRAEMFNRAGWIKTKGAGKAVRAGFMLYSVFLIYAFFRFLNSEVYVDAERSFLLFLTPAIIGAQVVFSFSSRQNRALFWIITINLILLGIYGVINHLFFHNAYTMWLPGEPQYQIGFFRATGSYVCPDHFSGIMELALGIGLALTLTRKSPAWLKVSGITLSALALAGVFFSKSRGGGLTVLVMLPTCLAFCLFTWKKRTRIYLRSGAFLAMLALFAVLLLTGNSYMQRFTSYFGLSEAKKAPAAEAIAHVKQRLKQTARGKMFSAAYRAWQTAPVFGVGAGMHQSLWPHFAASPDGDRAAMDWPEQINNTWHSYEVHNDWLQLLEEYGIAGLLLFLPPFVCLIVALTLLRRKARDEESSSWLTSVELISAILALTAMAFHSLGDFNLQMPATNWMLAVLVCIPLQLAVRPELMEKKGEKTPAHRHLRVHPYCGRD